MRDQSLLERINELNCKHFEQDSDEQLHDWVRMRIADITLELLENVL